MRRAEILNEEVAFDEEAFVVVPVVRTLDPDQAVSRDDVEALGT